MGGDKRHVHVLLRGLYRRRGTQMILTKEYKNVVDYTQCGIDPRPAERWLGQQWYQGARGGEGRG